MKLTDANVAACVGAYQIATTRVRITAREDKLVLEWPTGPAVELHHRGQLTFLLGGEADAKLVFRLENDKAASFELTRAGLVSTGRRMD